MAGYVSLGRRTPMEVNAMMDAQTKSGGWSCGTLRVIQFAVALWPPFYNKIEPT